MTTSAPLGRGLGSLIPNRTGEDASNVPHPQRLSVSRIRVNPRQPRSTITHAGLEELVESVREHGILQPLVVTPKGRDFELIAGERRFQAAKIVGLKTIPVVIRDATEQEQLELALVENLQRQDLNPLEESAAYQQLVDEFNLTQEQVAKRVGKSRSYVANTLRLQSLPDEVKKAILDGKLTEGHAKVLLSLHSREEQLTVLAQILRQGLTVRASEALATRHGAARKAPPVGKDPQLASDEDALRRALGTKVSIQRSGAGGKVIIEFYSREELQHFIERFREPL